MRRFLARDSSHIVWAVRSASPFTFRPRNRQSVLRTPGKTCSALRGAHTAFSPQSHTAKRSRPWRLSHRLAVLWIMPWTERERGGASLWRKKEKKKKLPRASTSQSCVQTKKKQKLSLDKEEKAYRTVVVALFEPRPCLLAGFRSSSATLSSMLQKIEKMQPITPRTRGIIRSNTQNIGRLSWRLVRRVHTGTYHLIEGGLGR